MASLLSLFVVCVLFVTIIESRVMRSNQIKVPPKGLTLEIVLRPNRAGEMQLQVKTIDFKRAKKGHKKFHIPTATEESEVRTGLGAKGVDMPATKRNEDKTPSVLPTIENRLGIVSGNCPDGYVSRGGFCFPDYD